MNPSRRQKAAAVQSLTAGRELTEHEKAVLGKVEPDQLEVPTEAVIADATTRALDAFEIAGSAVEQTLLAKAEAGRLLARKRQSLPHGDWLPWLNTMVPQRFRDRQAAEQLADAEKAWHREVQRWMKIADNFDRFPPEALERAHTVRQMLQLADFIPEGESSPGGHTAETNPAQVVARVEKWWTQQSAVLHRDEVKQWPPRDRADLVERLRPLVELYTELLPSA